MIITVDVYEPIDAVVTADSTAYTADNTTWPTADGGILVGALAASDATVIAAEIPIAGGGYRRPIRLEVVEGHGYGVLPPLRGEAHGVVYTVITLPPIRGEAHGEVGDDLALVLLLLLAA